MSLESAVYSALTAHAGVSDFVADRIYPRQIPQDIALPAIAYLRASTRGLGSLDCGDNCTENVRLQIDIITGGESGAYLQGRELAKQVRDAMKNATAFRSIKLQDKDMAGQNPDYHRVMLEFSVWYKEEV